LSSENLVRVFLPRRFTNVFSDTDTDMMNGGMIKIDLNAARVKKLMPTSFRWNTCRIRLWKM